MESEYRYRDDMHLVATAHYTHDELASLSRALNSSQTIGLCRPDLGDYTYKKYIDPELLSEIRDIVSEELDKKLVRLRNALAPIMSDEEFNELLK